MHRPLGPTYWAFGADRGRSDGLAAITLDPMLCHVACGHSVNPRGTHESVSFGTLWANCLVNSQLFPSAGRFKSSLAHKIGTPFPVVGAGFFVAPKLPGAS